jgi:phosphoribosylformylglycinamidine synthase subunit PurQ / glutaminase
VLGICNGFQILCEAGLLPGVLRRNESLSFVCRDVPLERSDTPFRPGAKTARPSRSRSSTPRATGTWTMTSTRLEARRQIVLRYGEPVNGSRNDVAGVMNKRGNVMGLMPHPERAVDPAAQPTAP